MIQRRYFDSTAGQIHCRTAGQENKPALLLLHQAPSHSGMFDALMAQLADDFYCIAPDFPGCGLSDPIDDLTIEKIAEAVAAALQPVVDINGIFGHHSGSAVAAELAVHHYSKAEFVVFSGPALLSVEQQQKLPTSVPDTAVSQTGEHLATCWQFLRSKDAQVPLSVTQREVLSALTMGATYRQLYQAVADYDFARAIQQIACPTLVFAGDRDVLKEAVAPTVALLPNGYQGDIGDASTYVCETRPQQVAGLIKQFSSER